MSAPKEEFQKWSGYEWKLRYWDNTPVWVTLQRYPTMPMVTINLGNSSPLFEGSLEQLDLLCRVRDRIKAELE